MNDPQTEPRNDKETDVRPSDMLRKAREEHKLTQQEVASRLHLDLRIITAIDNGQYASLASPSYTRGYLRAYARLLKMDAEPIIAAYDREADEAPAILPHASSPAQQIESNDTLIKVISWLVGIVLLALLLLWARDRFAGQDIDFSLSVLGLKPSLQEGPSAPGQAPAPAPIPKPAPMAATTDAQTSGVEEFRRLEQTVQPGPGSTLEQSPTEAAPPVTPPERPGASALTTEELKAGADSAESAPAVSTATETAADTGEIGPELHLQLADKAWIEISDADGKRLYYNLGKPGESITVSGRLPYTVKIGHAGSVTAQLGGKPLDLGPYSVYGVARLRINGTDDIVENR